mmetsp:Transcript_67820/g.113643  ORF Transcript_67820/g.113643 Transcript_67820/m.113643 type:complete len:107 (-) Transcript_67820:1430-1750(-)
MPKGRESISWRQPPGCRLQLCTALLPADSSAALQEETPDRREQGHRTSAAWAVHSPFDNQPPRAGHFHHQPPSAERQLPKGTGRASVWEQASDKNVPPRKHSAPPS